MTQHRTCRVLSASRSSMRYVPVKPGEEELRMRRSLQRARDGALHGSTCCFAGRAGRSTTNGQRAH